MITTREHTETFACFGSQCAVLVAGHGSRGGAAEAAAHARRALLAWHGRFTRFETTSELSRLNADPRDVVPVTAVMARLAMAVVRAAEQTGGLVDGTLLGELEVAGYEGDLGEPLVLELVLALAPPRRPAGPSPASRWREIELAGEGRAVRRPPGVALDSGGLAKGLFADLLAEDMAGYESLAIDCAGDLRVSGAARAVHVASPFGGEALHTFEVADGAVATSGIGVRSWLDADGSPAHHLLDARTGRPAFTGVVQATALAPTALEAEIRAKAAVLSGPVHARAWLPHGGVVVRDDGGYDVVTPNPTGGI
jgi:thiamine biosynthesis lipoprotein